MKLSLSLDAKRMIAVIAVLSLVMILGGAIYFRSAEALPFAYGVLLVCALNCFKVLMIEHTVQRAARKGDCVGAYTGGQYFARFALTGLVLWLTAVSDLFNLWWAILSLFTFHIAAHMMRYFIERDDAKLERGPDV